MSSKGSMPQLRVGEQRALRGLGRDDAQGTTGVPPKATAIAIDPGGTNGWAIWTPRIGYNVGQCKPEEIWGLLGLAVEHDVDAIVYEGFKYFGDQVHVDLTPVEVIGVIKEWCRQNKWAGRLVAQRPVDVKFFFHDGRIKERGLWVPGKRHSMDALRHLLHFQRAFV